jgi:hypothetical protein
MGADGWIYQIDSVPPLSLDLADGGPPPFSSTILIIQSTERKSIKVTALRYKRADLSPFN